MTFVHSQPGKATSGIISGVINANDLVSKLQGVAGNISSTLCQQSTFQSIANSILAASDILDDGTNRPGTPCNAISIGLGFEADRIGNPKDIGAPSTGANPCEDGGAPGDDGGGSGDGG